MTAGDNFRCRGGGHGSREKEETSEASLTHTRFARKTR